MTQARPPAKVCNTILASKLFVLIDWAMSPKASSLIGVQVAQRVLDATTKCQLLGKASALIPCACAKPGIKSLARKSSTSVLGRWVFMYRWARYKNAR